MPSDSHSLTTRQNSSFPRDRHSLTIIHPELLVSEACPDAVGWLGDQGDKIISEEY